MKFSSSIATTLLCAVGSTVAAPLLSVNIISVEDLADKIAKVAPESVTCSPQLTECRNATQVAPYFLEAIKKYGTTAPGQIAGILALTAFESVNYQYKHNTNVDHHGQGTSNQQMAKFNILYAQSIPELKSQLDPLSPFTSTDQMDQVLDLVVPDEYNFGTGPWFLKTQCEASVVSALAAGDQAGFDAYMGCVGVTMTQKRTDYWTRAQAAFGLA